MHFILFSAIYINTMNDNTCMFCCSPSRKGGVIFILVCIFLSLATSLGNMTLIAFDRAVAVHLPFSYRQWVTIKRAIVVGEIN